ncbi:MAG TPA: alpha/beta hydrolase [Prosthecobacter sp.]|nr:alpha/beta hydrolase [Prosthecobacter sp.]
MKPTRRHLICAIAALLLATPAGAQQAGKKKAGTDRPEPAEKRVYKTAGESKLEIWIWKPQGWKAEDKRPAMVFYHGGGWRGGAPTSFSRQSAQLAARGMVAMSVQYRLTSQPGVGIANCVEDARSAFRWVRAHAGELGIDPDRIAAGGGSAGGHLAAALATLDEVNDPDDDLSIPLKPAALVLFNPALVLESPRAAEAARLDSVASLRAYSPYSHVKKGHPPALILHGEADTTVPIATARQYAARVVELGGQCEVVGYEGAPHSFFNRSPHFEQTSARMEQFLQSLGWLKRE